MSDDDVREVRKKPSGGLSYSRKLNTGQEYENEELEIWASTGSVDREELEDELKDLTDTLVKQMEEKVKEFRAREGEIPRELKDKLMDIHRAAEKHEEDRVREMLKKMVRGDEE